MVMSLLLSLAIWVAAVQEQNPVEEREFDAEIPILLTGLDNNLVISGTFTQTVRVSMRAPSTTWNSISLEDFTVSADLSGLPSGSHEIDLEVDLPENVQATRVIANPPNLSITLEEERQRTMPVRVVVEGQALVGFARLQEIITPEEVVVSGPVSAVDRVSEVRVTVDVTDAREPVEALQTVAALDSEGNLIESVTLVPAQVNVNVPVVQRPNFKEVSVIVQREGIPAAGYYISSIDVTPLTLTVQGPANVISEMPGFVETTPIDVNGLRDSLTLSAGIVLPEGVSAVDQPTIEVQVAVSSFQGSLELTLPVEVIGLPENLEAVLTPETLDVVLSGPVGELDLLTEEDIHVVLDLADFDIGTYQIEPEFIILPENVVVRTVLPAMVQVIVRVVVAAP